MFEFFVMWFLGLYPASRMMHEEFVKLTAREGRPQMLKHYLIGARLMTVAWPLVLFLAYTMALTVIVDAWVTAARQKLTRPKK